MHNLFKLYQERLNLKDATFSRIDHPDGIVAIVYRVTLPSDESFILKICQDANHYFREVYFLTHLIGKIPVPRLISTIPPEGDVPGAVLMECLPGVLLAQADLTEELTYEMGALLAQIHLNRVSGYGDLIRPEDLSEDPKAHFTFKFKEGIAECTNHLPHALLEKCCSYYDAHINLLTSIDGPCMTHRDFRPGNIIVNEGKVQGIIDWSSGRGSFAEEDFCSMEHGEWLKHFNKQSFLAGYASIRPVPDYATIMPLLRLSKAVATIGFTIKRGTWDKEGASLYQFNRRYMEELVGSE